MAASRSPRSSKSSSRSPSIAVPFEALIARESWAPLPAVVVLSGGAAFLRRQVERRFVSELFGEQPMPALQRFDGSQNAEDLLAKVLDELRTVSLLSAERLVMVDSADAFLSEHRDALLPFVERGFAGGHLVLHLEKKVDERTKFAKAVGEHGWLVACVQPFDRPPPWQADAPPWENPLSKWITAWARQKGLRLDVRTAYQLQERVGTDLGVIDESLEKIRTYLGDRSTVDLKAIEAITGELREDSLFDLVDAFVAGDRVRALHMAERLFASGYHPAKGNPIHDASSIAIMFTGALVTRLKTLRRAHALGSERTDAWIEQRLTTRPFVDRFRREVRSMPPPRIEKAFAGLLELDRSIKTGGDPRLGLTIVLARD